MRSIGHAIGIPFGQITGLPFGQWLLRFLKPQIGSWVYDLIGIYDADETSPDLFDMNPDGYSDPDIDLTIMDRSNASIWSETDANGDSIRDLSDYNPLDPYEWDRENLTVDIFDTYLNVNYLYRLFANFFDPTTTLAFYDRQLTCAQQKYVHQKLKTGNIWILNRGVWNDCAIWKDGAKWRD